MTYKSVQSHPTRLNSSFAIPLASKNVRGPTFFGTWTAGACRPSNSDFSTRYIQDSGSWLVAARHVVFPAGRQQRSPHVHFKGIVVKTPSKIRRSFGYLPPRDAAHLALAGQDEFGHVYAAGP